MSAHNHQDQPTNTSENAIISANQGDFGLLTGISSFFKLFSTKKQKVSEKPLKYIPVRPSRDRPTSGARRSRPESSRPPLTTSGDNPWLSPTTRSQCSPNTITTLANYEEPQIVTSNDRSGAAEPPTPSNLDLSESEDSIEAAIVPRQSNPTDIIVSNKTPCSPQEEIMTIIETKRPENKEDSDRSKQTKNRPVRYILEINKPTRSINEIDIDRCMKMEFASKQSALDYANSGNIPRDCTWLLIEPVQFLK